MTMQAFIIANALWLVFSIAAMSFANLLSSGVFAVINVYGWRRWRRERLMAITAITCYDHYRVECTYCHEIVRQCRCLNAIPKTITRDGICGSCKAMVIPPLVVPLVDHTLGKHDPAQELSQVGLSSVEVVPGDREPS